MSVIITDPVRSSAKAECHRSVRRATPALLALWVGCGVPSLEAPPPEAAASTTQASSSITIWGDPASSQTIVQPVGTALTVSGAARFTGTLAGRAIAGIYNVDQLAALGTGTATNPWSGWEGALNALPAGVEIYFPAGFYTQSKTVTVKQGWTVRGAGSRASKITTTTAFTGDAFQSISPYNSSSAANVLIQDLWIVNANPQPTGAAVDVVGGTFVNIKRIQTEAFKYGVVLDQAELADVEESGFSGTSSAACIWIANANEHQAQAIPGVPSSPQAAAGFTNRIGIRKNQISCGATSIGIIDDGGYAHALEANNYNGGRMAIYLAGVIVGHVSGGEFESQSSAIVTCSFVTGQGQKPGIGPNVNISFFDNVFSASAGNPAIDFLDGGPYTIVNNLVNGNVPSFRGVPNIVLEAHGNLQATGLPLFDANPVVGLVSTLTGVGVQAAAPTAELEVNGGVRLNTAKLRPTCATPSRGELWFQQGGSGVKDSAQICAKDATGAFAWRTLY